MIEVPCDSPHWRWSKLSGRRMRAVNLVAIVGCDPTGPECDRRRAHRPTPETTILAEAARSRGERAREAVTVGAPGARQLDQCGTAGVIDEPQLGRVDVQVA